MIIDEMDELERLIDKHGLADVLETMADICHLKARHIAESYGDNDPDQIPWDMAAGVLDRTSRRTAIRLLS